MGKWLRGGLALIGGWVVFFLVMQGVVGGVASRADNTVSAVPETRGMGLEYAKAVVLKQKKFLVVRAHDASGRGRGVGDGQGWHVCEQYTVEADGALKRIAGAVKRGSQLDLGVLQLDETCTIDLTLSQNPDLAYPMPNYRGFTPAEIIKAMRKEASLRFYALDGSQVSERQYGQWRVCSQQLRKRSTFYGQPVAFVAVRYDQNSKAVPPQPNDLDQLCREPGWRGVSGFPADRFPELI